MTPSKHQHDYRKRKAKQGLVRVEVWVPEWAIDFIRALAREPLKLNKRPSHVTVDCGETGWNYTFATKDQSDE